MFSRSLLLVVWLFNSVKILNERGKTNSAFKLLYDAIHTLAEAMAATEGIQSYNHECLFAHLCATHPELRLDWELFEKMRTLRNGLNYYGKRIDEEEWRDLEKRSRAVCDAMRTLISATRPG